MFVSALRDALVAGEVDLAVHSYKDLPTAADPRLVIAAVPPREDPRDALVARDGRMLGELPAGATVGTGSPRRVAQLDALGLGLRTVPIRGNVDTRIGKVRSGELDAVVVAAAGLRRLGRIDEASELLDPMLMLPAPAQGALAVECRAADTALAELLAQVLDDAPRGPPSPRSGRCWRRWKPAAAPPSPRWPTWCPTSTTTAGSSTACSCARWSARATVRCSARRPPEPRRRREDRYGTRRRTARPGRRRSVATEGHAGPETLNREQIDEPHPSTPGRVAFVGSGPGDPGLLTVRARDALGRAPLVVTDPDVPDGVLALVADGAEVRPAVGEPGDVAKVLIAEATAGRSVVHLVGGDPLTADAVVAEILAVAAAGLPFDVVPGVAPGTAVPTYAGVPLGSAHVEDVRAGGLRRARRGPRPARAARHGRPPGRPRRGPDRARPRADDAGRRHLRRHAHRAEDRADHARDAGRRGARTSPARWCSPSGTPSSSAPS